MAARLTINKHVGEFWMMIHSAWVGRWVLFAMGTADPPGPITNLSLFHKGDDDDNEDNDGDDLEARSPAIGPRET